MEIFGGCISLHFDQVQCQLFQSYRQYPFELTDLLPVEGNGRLGGLLQGKELLTDGNIMAGHAGISQVLRLSCLLFIIFIKGFQVVSLLHGVAGIVLMYFRDAGLVAAEMIKDQLFAGLQVKMTGCVPEGSFVEIPGSHVIAGMPEDGDTLEIQGNQVDPQLIRKETPGRIVISFLVSPFPPPSQKALRPG